MRRRVLSRHPPFADARFVAARTNTRGWVVLDTRTNRTVTDAGTMDRAMGFALELSRQEVEEHPRPKPAQLPAARREHRWSIGRIVERLLGRVRRKGPVEEPSAPERLIDVPATLPASAPLAVPRTQEPISTRRDAKRPVRRVTRPRADRTADGPVRTRTAPKVAAAPPFSVPPVTLSSELVLGIRSRKRKVRRVARIQLLESCLPAGITWRSEGDAAGIRVWVEDDAGHRLHEVRHRSFDSALLRLVEELTSARG